MYACTLYINLITQCTYVLRCKCKNGKDESGMREEKKSLLSIYGVSYAKAPVWIIKQIILKKTRTNLIEDIKRMCNFVVI